MVKFSGVSYFSGNVPLSQNERQEGAEKTLDSTATALSLQYNATRIELCSTGQATEVKKGQNNAFLQKRFWQITLEIRKLVTQSQQHSVPLVETHRNMYWRSNMYVSPTSGSIGTNTWCWGRDRHRGRESRLLQLEQGRPDCGHGNWYWGGAGKGQEEGMGGGSRGWSDLDNRVAAGDQLSQGNRTTGTPARKKRPFQSSMLHLF